MKKDDLVILTKECSDTKDRVPIDCDGVVLYRRYDGLYKVAFFSPANRKILGQFNVPGHCLTLSNLKMEESVNEQYGDFLKCVESIQKNEEYAQFQMFKNVRKLTQDSNSPLSKYDK